MFPPSTAPNGDARSALNRLLDALPRPTFFRHSCERPAFRSLGVAGYYAALVATLGAGLLAGRSLVLLSAVAAACALSFFGWAYLRRAVTGRETLVLLEHVWVAELVSAGTLRLLHQPLLPYLDAVSVGLAVFLAWGRAGCLLAGCCYGHPASVGVRYTPEAARHGFPEHLVGVRLFPVQAIEALGLSVIGIVGLGLAAGAVEGRALVWFLASYAVMRFGLEGLRADERPHVLGLSQSRWMALVELGVALFLDERIAPAGPRALMAAAFVVVVLLGALVARSVFDPRRRLLRDDHVAELRALAREQLRDAAAHGPQPVPSVGRTSQWVSVAASLLEDGSAHLSLSLPSEWGDLRLLCDVAVAAVPELEPRSGRTAPSKLLHVRAPRSLPETAATASPRAANALYGAVLRHAEPPAVEPSLAGPAHEPPSLDDAARATPSQPPLEPPRRSFADIPLRAPERAPRATDRDIGSS